MKIAVVGRGNVGGGLADKWEQAGHSVTRIGKDGGDVSDAEAVLIAVPGGAIEDALDKVQGLEGKTAIDATNLFGADRPAGFNWLNHSLKIAHEYFAASVNFDSSSRRRARVRARDRIGRLAPADGWRACRPRRPAPWRSAPLEGRSMGGAQPPA
jgi:hypothetical protein